jgi:hypothetical protein
MTNTMRDSQCDDVLSSAGRCGRADVPAPTYVVITPTVARKILHLRCSRESPQGLLQRATRLARWPMIASAAVGYGWLWAVFFLG